MDRTGRDESGGDYHKHAPLRYAPQSPRNGGRLVENEDNRGANTLYSPARISGMNGPLGLGHMGGIQNPADILDGEEYYQTLPPQEPLPSAAERGVDRRRGRMKPRDIEQNFNHDESDDDSSETSATLATLSSSSLSYRCTPQCLQVAGVLLLLVGVVVGIGLSTGSHLFFSRQIRQEIQDHILVDSMNSEQYEYWVSDDIVESPPVLLSVYFYNLTNAALVRTSGATPSMESVGPYTFRRYISKFDVSFASDGTNVTYNEYIHYEFQTNSSSDASLDDIIVNVNPVYISLLSSSTPSFSSYSPLNGGGGVTSSVPSGPTLSLQTPITEDQLLHSWVGPTIQLTMDFMSTTFVDFLYFLHLPSTLNQSILPTITNTSCSVGSDCFLSLWANATQLPSPAWLGMIVSDGGAANGTPSASGISMASAQMLFDAATPYSFMYNPDNFTTDAVLRNSGGKNHNDSDDVEILLADNVTVSVWNSTALWYLAAYQDNTQASSALQEMFALSSDEMTLVLQWFTSSLVPSRISPFLLSAYTTLDVHSTLDLAFLQWGSASFTPNRTSLARLYSEVGGNVAVFAPAGGSTGSFENVAGIYCALQPCIPEYAAWWNLLFYGNGVAMNVTVARGLFSGQTGIFNMGNMWTFWEDYVKDDMGDIESTWSITQTEIGSFGPYLLYMSDYFSNATMQSTVFADGSGLFSARSVDEWIFGASDPLLSLMYTEASPTPTPMPPIVATPTATPSHAHTPLPSSTPPVLVPTLHPTPSPSPPVSTHNPTPTNVPHHHPSATATPTHTSTPSSTHLSSSTYRSALGLGSDSPSVGFVLFLNDTSEIGAASSRLPNTVNTGKDDMSLVGAYILLGESDKLTGVYPQPVSVAGAINERDGQLPPSRLVTDESSASSWWNGGWRWLSHSDDDDDGGGSRASGDDDDDDVATTLKVWDDEYLRPVDLVPVSIISWQGFVLRRYEMSNETWVTSTFYEQPYQGLANLTGAYRSTNFLAQDAPPQPLLQFPIFLSNPYLFLASPTWASKVDGIQTPDPAVEVSYVDVEAYTGKALRVFKTTQYNVYVPSNISFLLLNPTAPTDLVYPLFYTTLVATADTRTLSSINTSVYHTLVVQAWVWYVCIMVGALSIMTGVAVLLLGWKRKRALRLRKQAERKTLDASEDGRTTTTTATTTTIIRRHDSIDEQSYLVSPNGRIQ